MTSSFIEQLLLFSDSIAHYFVTKVTSQKSHLLLRQWQRIVEKALFNKNHDLLPIADLAKLSSDEL